MSNALAVNATRWKLFETLQATGLPVECGSGGRTKFNRVTRNLEKTHWLDAACVGASTPPMLLVSQVKPLHITATGHGSRQMCQMDKFGFPRTGPKAKHFSHAFKTGDIIKAIIPAHLTHAGTHTGRMSAKAKGGFTICTQKGNITDVGKQYCRILQKADGYGYSQISASADAFLSSPSLKA